MPGAEQDIAICARDIGKVYRIYDRPEDRLKQMLFARFGRSYGRDFCALQNVSFTVHCGEVARSYWSQRQRQEHVAADSGWDTSAELGRRGDPREGSSPSGTGQRVQSGIYWTGECLSERFSPGVIEEADGCPL